MPWDDELTLMLLELYRKGETYAKIAAAVNATGKIQASRNAVAGKLKRLGVTIEQGPRKTGIKKATATKTEEVKKLPKPEPKKVLVKPRRKRVRLRDRELYYLGLTKKEDRKILNIPNITGCKWVYGDVRNPDSYWCGAPVKAGSCWCRKHYSIVYVKERTKHTRFKKWRF